MANALVGVRRRLKHVDDLIRGNKNQGDRLRSMHASCDREYLIELNRRSLAILSRLRAGLLEELRADRE